MPTKKRAAKKRARRESTAPRERSGAQPHSPHAGVSEAQGKDAGAGVSETQDKDVGAGVSQTLQDDDE